MTLDVNGVRRTQEAEIVVDDIGIELGAREVLRNVNIEVSRGEFICLIGASGCGKTTLLNIMAGFIAPSRGEVRVRGERVTGPDRRRIFVFQENGVFPWLTVAQNIALGLNGLPKAERAEIVRRYTEMVGLSGFESAYPKELSGGMRQRVEIARALATNPDVIYMDEPFGALDHITRLRMRAELVRIWQREGKTIVFVTHDIDEAVELADRVVVMGERPSTCRRIVTIEAQRPRDLDAPECVALRHLLTAAIDSRLSSGVHAPSPATDREFPDDESGATMQESMKPSERAAEPETHDYLVVGAGPAGLQLSYFLRRAGRDHKVIERASGAGAFFRDFPRHRKLISINKVHTGIDDAETNLRWDWNSLLSEDGPLFSHYTERYFPGADAMVDYLGDFAKQHELPIEYGFDVALIERESAEGCFLVTSKTGRTVRARRLVIATGLYKPWLPNFPGAELCEPYTSVSVEPRDFTGQRVLILGKGNSAFETADNLIETTASIHLVSPRPLRMAWRTHFVGHLRAVNNNVLDTYHLKSQNAVLDAEVLEIKREAEEYVVTVAYTHADHEVETLRYDRVIACTGFEFDAEMFGSNCRPELKPCGRLPVMSSEWESSNIPDLFFAGTLMQYRDYKKYMSGFIHGFRYNVRALSRVLDRRYHGAAWPAQSVRQTPVALVTSLLARANRSSALWQQPGFLCDALQLSAEGQSASYMEELPVDLARDSLFDSGRWLMLTLEFGEAETDPFDIPRIHRHDTQRASQSVFLHPIVRFYEQGRLLAEHHVIEDLAAVWNEPEHFLPLQRFIEEVLAGSRSESLAPEHQPRESAVVPARPNVSGSRAEEDVVRGRVENREATGAKS